MYAIPTIPNLVYIIIMMIMRVTSTRTTRTTFNNNHHDCITFLQKGLTSPMNNKRYNYNHALYYNIMIIRSTKSKDDIPSINNNLLLQLRGGSKHTTTSSNNIIINDNDDTSSSHSSLSITSIDVTTTKNHHSATNTICKLKNNSNDTSNNSNNNNYNNNHHKKGIIIKDSQNVKSVHNNNNNNNINLNNHDCAEFMEIQKTSHREEKKEMIKEESSENSNNENHNHTLKTNNVHTTPIKERRKKIKRKSKSSIASERTKTKYTGGGKQGECLRRLKHEWKQIIKLGIAYDWVTQQTITIKGKHSTSGQQEMKNDDLFYRYNYIRVGPFRNNMLHWHFSIQGPKNSVYENGIYHGRIILPKSYPLSPPRVQLLTPSGRFIPGDDICLSASAFHPETWTPRWTILSLIEALRIHMLTTANEIGGVHASDESRRKFAAHSRSWKMGCLNHEQMVNNGLFCSKPIVESNDDEEQINK